jgi:hypothetical protein
MVVEIQSNQKLNTPAREIWTARAHCKHCDHLRITKVLVLCVWVICCCWRDASTNAWYGRKQPDGSCGCSLRRFSSNPRDSSNNIVLHMWCSYGLEPGEHVCELHQDKSRYNGGDSEKCAYAVLSGLWAISQPTEALGCLPARVERAPVDMLEENKRIE